MPNTVLGKVSIVPRGEYSVSETYQMLDYVQYQGSGFIVRKECTGVTPADGEYYMLAAARGADGQKGADGTLSFEDLTPEQKASLKGDKGDPGSDGPPGEQGPQGPAGTGVPTGGSAGTVLSKASSADYDTAWISPVGVKMTGTVEPTPDITDTAFSNAEIFNDYKTRTFNSDGTAYQGNVAYGTHSHAEGAATTAIGDRSHAEGSQTIAQSNYSHAEGSKTTASGQASHVEGTGTTASAKNAHAEGMGTVANGAASHAEGSGTTAEGAYSHADGTNTKAQGMYSYAGGVGTVAHYMERAIGAYNVDSGAKDLAKGNPHNALIVGIGSTSTARANAFRVASDGVYGTSAFKSTGADYAEMFEWEDGNPNNEDRVGRFVTLRGEKISLAGPLDDFILGVVSGNPTVVGDAHEDMWQGMYVYDVFGRRVFEDVQVSDELDEEGNVISPAHTETREKINPEYDHTVKYIGRQNRPEWSAVGMMGKLVMIDDGTCQIDGWCQPGKDGIATNSAERTKYRVINRLDDTHIRVLIL